jgi:hypothetical protein
MKIRSGFVSNSSSSSFLVAFSRAPASKEELKTLLFGGSQRYLSPYDKRVWPTDQVAETVWSDLKELKPLTPEQMVSKLAEGTITGKYSSEYRDSWKEYMDAKTPEARDKAYDVMQANITKRASEVAAKFTSKNTGAKFFEFHYSDNDGSYGTDLEHGDLFANLPHIRVSHH